MPSADRDSYHASLWNHGPQLFQTLIRIVVVETGTMEGHCSTLTIQPISQIPCTVMKAHNVAAPLDQTVSGLGVGA